MNSWIEVSEERLSGNFHVISEAAGPETGVLAVVKANAYGHGIEVCSTALVRAGALWLGVASASEGQRVREALCKAGLDGKGAELLQPQILLMCGFLPEDVGAIVEHRLTPAIWTQEQLRWLAGSGVRVHLEVDTGMQRQGVHPGAELDALLDAMSSAGIVLDGVLTHFYAAEVADNKVTREQRRRFAAAIAQAKARGLTPKWIHAGSSSSVDNAAQSGQWLAELAKTLGARAMVRCGIALYGYCLPIEGGHLPATIREKLQPVMTWQTRVLDVREVAAGDTVGYNATFKVESPMRLALLPVGYADGLRRALSSTNAKPGGWVMVGSKCAEIIGRISMNLTTVDVTAIDGVGVGDEVVLLGDGVTADDHARLAGTIPYEILCGLRAG